MAPLFVMVGPNGAVVARNLQPRLSRPYGQDPYVCKHGCTLAATAGGCQGAGGGSGYALHIAYMSRPPLVAVDCDPCGISARHPYTLPETSAPVTGVSVVKSYGPLSIKDPAGGTLTACPPST